MEISDIAIRPGIGESIEAELRGDAPSGDRGYYVSIVGWGGTEDEARGQIEAALRALGLSVQKLRDAV